MKLRVLRILVVEGDERWVRDILSKSYLKPDEGYVYPNGYQKEITRAVEVIEDEKATTSDGMVS
jgi:hypothetical protein